MSHGSNSFGSRYLVGVREGAAMSDSEEDYDDDEEEEDLDEDEDGEDEEGEGGEAEAEALKKEAVAGDIAMLLDVFGYIDRTTRRITSRLEVESKVGGKNRKKTLGPYVTNSAAQAEAAATDGNARGDLREDAFEGREVNEDDELVGGWSQYETMNDADRGMLLEKAILALGLNQEDEH